MSKNIMSRLNTLSIFTKSMPYIHVINTCAFGIGHISNRFVYVSGKGFKSKQRWIQILSLISNQSDI